MCRERLLLRWAGCHASSSRSARTQFGFPVWTTPLPSGARAQRRHRCSVADNTHPEAVRSPDTIRRSERIRKLARALNAIDPDATYIVATLPASHGRMGLSFYSRFAGFPEGVRAGEGVELRRASLVDPHIMSADWEEIDQEWIVVNDLAALIVFNLHGGNALVTEDIADGYLATYMAPHVCVSMGAGGFVRKDAVLRELSKQQPRPKHRRRILERDNF